MHQEQGIYTNEGQGKVNRASYGLHAAKWSIANDKKSDDQLLYYIIVRNRNKNMITLSMWTHHVSPHGVHSHFKWLEMFFKPVSHSRGLPHSYKCPQLRVTRQPKPMARIFTHMEIWT